VELGIGTGRIALPLAARGVDVRGVDASPQMVARLRAKPGGATIPVMIGDFGDLAVEGRFALVYVVFNTFFGLTTQEAQVRCFQRVAERLTDDGVFTLELFMPDMTRFANGQNFLTNRVGTDQVTLDASLHDPLTQRVTTQHIVLSASGVRLYPIQIRYAWPSELDLMARLAGLDLRHRWSNWRRDPWTAASGKHISVYGRAPA
jgi:hypothetical protein